MHSHRVWVELAHRLGRKVEKNGLSSNSDWDCTQRGSSNAQATNDDDLRSCTHGETPRLHHDRPRVVYLLSISDMLAATKRGSEAWMAKRCGCYVVPAIASGVLFALLPPCLRSRLTAILGLRYLHHCSNRRYDGRDQGLNFFWSQLSLFGHSPPHFWALETSALGFCAGGERYVCMS